MLFCCPWESLGSPTGRNQFIYLFVYLFFNDALSTTQVFDLTGFYGLIKDF
jgi:hypothetical protein